LRVEGIQDGLIVDLAPDRLRLTSPILQHFLQPSREQSGVWVATRWICVMPRLLCLPQGSGCDIPKEQAQKLLTAGKADVLDGFISKRGRPFSAYLKLEDGKVGFEFPQKTADAARQ
jgi:hypothetical protein